jgi:tetratricopeptide (TPR) repeat protein
VTAIVVTALVIGIPAVAFVLWPLLRGGRSGVLMPLPPDPREWLLEDKARILASLRELTFEHDAGHVSDDDYADLYARYEADAAAVLEELDRVAAATNVPAPHAPEIVSRRSAWTHPIALAASAVGLVVFGILLGSGVARHTAPDPTAGEAPIGSRPLADLSPASPAPTPETPAGGAPRTVTPEILQGMLQAARASLFAGRYSEAIAAYQAVLKRDPNNVDATTHLGLILAVGGGPDHADRALEIFDRALTIDPNYLPALLYRGQVLFEAKHDAAGAVRSWEKFVALAPPGEDRDRVAKMIREAQAKH